MALLSIPVRLASRARLLAADVAAAFAPIVAAVNGGLDASNYAPGARIPNSLKSAPRSIFALEAHLTGYVAGVTYTLAIPVGVGIAEEMLLEPFQWDVMVSNHWITGTAKLYVDGVQVGTTQNYAVAGNTRVSTEALALAPAAIGSVHVEIVCTASSGATGNLHVIVWCKAPHVR
jgi:hypothetical protein